MTALREWNVDDSNEVAPTVVRCRLHGTLEWDDDARVEEDVAECSDQELNSTESLSERYLARRGNRDRPFRGAK